MTFPGKRGRHGNSQQDMSIGGPGPLSTKAMVESTGISGDLQAVDTAFCELWPRDSYVSISGGCIDLLALTPLALINLFPQIQGLVEASLCHLQQVELRTPSCFLIHKFRGIRSENVGGVASIDSDGHKHSILTVKALLLSSGGQG